VPVAGSYWATAIGIGGAAGVSGALWGMSCPPSVALRPAGDLYCRVPADSPLNDGFAWKGAPWLDGALQNWSHETGGANDLDKLRGLRADLTSSLRSADQPHDARVLPSASVSARVGPDGTALLEPRGDGHRRVSAIVLIETFTAQRLDTWRLLKI
jgi:hypothetical protein